MTPRYWLACLSIATLTCCSKQSRQDRVTWQASIDNGDKPGCGIVLVEQAGQFSASFLVLDPDRPHEFACGRSLPTETTRIDENTLRIMVRLNATETDEMLAHLPSRFDGEKVTVTIQDAKNKDRSAEWVFVRQRSAAAGK